MEECCVHDCNFKTHENITFFKVPASSAIARKWLKAVGRKSRFDSQSLVCSRHFRGDEMTECRGKMRLKAKVVPSVFSKRPKLKKKTTPASSEESDTGRSDKKENDSDASDNNGNTKSKSKDIAAPTSKTDPLPTPKNKKDPVSISVSIDDAAPTLNSNEDSVPTSESQDESVPLSKSKGVSVPTSESGDDSVPLSKSKDDSVPLSKSKDVSVPTSESGDDSVPLSKSKDDSVPLSKSKDVSVPSSESGDDSVPLSKSKDDSVPLSKSKDVSVPTSESGDDSVPLSKSKDVSVPTSESGDDSVPLSKSKDDSVPPSKSKDNSVPTSKSQEESVPETTNRRRTLRKRTYGTINGAVTNRRIISSSDSDGESDSDSYDKKNYRRHRKKKDTVWKPGKVSKKNEEYSSKENIADDGSSGNKEGERVGNGGEENGDNSGTEKTESVNDDNSTGCNILVTPSIEFFYDHDDTAADPEPETGRPDIEDILTNYQIAQNNIHIGEDPEDLLASTMIMTAEKNKVALPENTEEEKPANSTAAKSANENADLTANRKKPVSTNDRSTISSNGISTEKMARPEFIEVCVDGETATCRTSDKADCLLLLENVEVDVDPSELMLATADTDDEGRKVEPISLVTSSDESDVVLQEPNIDTVEVSSADEDDMPLTELVNEKKYLTFPEISWGQHEFFCFHCGFTTKQRRDFKRHQALHTTCDVVYLMCEHCEFTSSSDFQMRKHKKTHKRAHKDEKLYKCHLCAFRAKHRMSLTYHLREHKKRGSTKDYVCDQCGAYQTNLERKFDRHRKMCMQKNKLPTDGKKFLCDKCSYKTNRKNDMKRHIARRHAEKPESLSSGSE